MTCPI